MEISPEIGTLLFKGTGKANILFISDPFCGFCRNQYKYLMENKDKIAELKHLHMPMPNLHPTAPITCAVMAYAHDKLPQEQYAQIVDFVYTQVNETVQPAGQSNQPTLPTTAQEMEVVKKFFAAFPDLGKGQEFDALFYYIKGKYADVVNKETSIATTDLQMRGTPNTIVNGYIVRGFAKNELDHLLGVQ